ncbi:dienelactone hydrolase family protein [Paenibacillus sp. SYP-B4298]|uniref:dienelactone hydrolase family protein n=1 Tax=Paenibacillus sp. SYP-B4298 TaxID=2996034 RepID=UPI0022DDD5D9|nr:alpha/beta hydrolase family protein [Paenibacillus sp. SYP-B4298]
MWKADERLKHWTKEAADRRRERAAGETWAAHRSRVLNELKQSLGEFEPAQGFEPILLERVQCDGYVRERVELSGVAGLTFGAYVLIPDGVAAPLPGVVAVHGHGYGSRQICGMQADGTPEPEDQGIYRHFAVQLVRRGLLVIAPDVIGFGERMLDSVVAQEPDAPSSCYKLGTHLLMLGKTLTGLRVQEMTAALDYFATRPELDTQRIGIAGFSGGSLISYVTAALDERIAASLLIGFPNTFEDSILNVHHCFCNYTPGLLNTAELPELIGLLAPRPLFLESGDADPIFPKEGFYKAVQELQEIYAQSGASQETLSVDVFPGIHEVSGRRSFDWLKETLQGLPQ